MNNKPEDQEKARLDVKRREAEQREAEKAKHEKQKTEQREQKNPDGSSKLTPTPTQEEQDAFAHGARPMYHEPDGAPEQYHTPQDQMDNAETMKMKEAEAAKAPAQETKALEADKPAAYQTREARPRPVNKAKDEDEKKP